MPPAKCKETRDGTDVVVCEGMDEQKPTANANDWNWEEENAAEREKPSNDASWFDQFEQLFYGSSNGGSVVAAAQSELNHAEGAHTEEWAHSEDGTCIQEGESIAEWVYPEEGATIQEGGNIEEWIHPEEGTYIEEGTLPEEGTNMTDTTTQTHPQTADHQIYPAYQGYDQQQPAPSIPYDYEYVDTNSQTTDLFNTEQCIHTYNVVNTVEEIHTPEDVLLNQCHLMSIAGEITEYEESYLQQLVLQKDPSAKEALRRYSL